MKVKRYLPMEYEIFNEQNNPWHLDLANCSGSTVGLNKVMVSPGKLICKRRHQIIFDLSRINCSNDKWKRKHLLIPSYFFSLFLYLFSPLFLCPENNLEQFLRQIKVIVKPITVYINILLFSTIAQSSSVHFSLRNVIIILFCHQCLLNDQ